MRILYIQSTMVPPPLDQAKDRFLLLSRELEGDILQPLWFRTAEEVEAIFGPGSYPVYTVGRFRYHFYAAYKGDSERSRPATFWFYLKTGFRICRERRTQCIVAYSHMTTALCGLLLKMVTGVKLIPEIMNAPERAYLKEEPHPGIRGRLWHIYSTVCLHLTVFFCDRVHLLYPGQLAAYPLLRHKKASVFHDFTPVTGVVQARADDDNQCILLAGYPWFRKGADLAIDAFRRLAADFPLARLQIAGHFPDGVPQVLADGCPGIKVLGNVPHDRLMQLASQSSIMLLPSRNEGLPRILIEGMAAGLALVGSDVAGIPYLIRNGENGFIFPDCDIPALEQCLRRLLSDASLRRRMGQRSHELSSATLTDDAYATQFARMIAETVTIADASDRGTA